MCLVLFLVLLRLVDDDGESRDAERAECRCEKSSAQEPEQKAGISWQYRNK